MCVSEALGGDERRIGDCGLPRGLEVRLAAWLFKSRSVYHGSDRITAGV